MIDFLLLTTFVRRTESNINYILNSKEYIGISHKHIHMLYIGVDSVTEFHDQYFCIFGTNIIWQIRTMSQTTISQIYLYHFKLQLQNPHSIQLYNKSLVPLINCNTPLIGTVLLKQVPFTSSVTKKATKCGGLTVETAIMEATSDNR